MATRGLVAGIIQAIPTKYFIFESEGKPPFKKMPGWLHNGMKGVSICFDRSGVYFPKLDPIQKAAL
jgi:hypothetical protein